MGQKSFGAILREVLSREVEGEAGEKLRRLGYAGTWMDLLSQAQVEKAARGDTTAFRLLRDALAETQAAEISDLRSLTDEELRAMVAEAGP